MAGFCHFTSKPFEGTEPSVGVTEGNTTNQIFVLELISTYTVSGTVKDADEKLLQNATIAIEGTDHSTTTDAQGNYSIDGVEEGT